MSTNQEHVDSYRLVYLLRKGQVCEVWEAYREGEEHNRVAMKLLPRGNYYNREQIGFLRHEYNIGRKFNHPNVIKIHKFADVAEGAYVLMELFRAPNLKQRIHDGIGKLAHQLDTIVRDAAMGLAYLHSKGWVHRDIKPDNFLVNDQGRVKLIDFNLTIRKQGLLQRLMPGRSKVQGTMSYMSPEQIRGQAIDARADVYSFGCMLHELLAGKPPYTGASVQDLLTKHLRSGIPSVMAADDNIFQPFAKLVQKMLVKDAKQRLPSMEAFIEEFQSTPIFREKPKAPQVEVPKSKS